MDSTPAIGTSDARSFWIRGLGMLAAADLRLFNLAYRCRGPRGFARSMWWVTKSGDGPLYLIIGALVFLLQGPQAIEFLKMGLIGFTIERGCYFGFKNLIRRDRPSARLTYVTQGVHPMDRYSFPSGHTAAAFLMASLLAAFYPVVTIPVFMWASAIGYSRIYHGIHYPADVIAGMLLGLGCAELAMGWGM